MFPNFIPDRGMPWRANSTADREAVERHVAFGIGKFSDPVYTTGDWPEALKDILPPAILPRFTKKEQGDILGAPQVLVPSTVLQKAGRI